MQIVSEELVKLMGGEVSELSFAKSGPTVILLAGLQGVGKTTVSAKLAVYLKKQVLMKFLPSLTSSAKKDSQIVHICNIYLLHRKCDYQSV